jgi:MSHA pilin protein MshA
MYTNTHQRGFSLVELVLVIVILGILAAAALPRFSDLSTQARQSAVNGLAGAVRSAASVAKATQLATGVAANGSISMESFTVTMNGRYPTATSTGIDNTLSDTTGFAATGSSPRIFRLQAGGCEVQYNVTGTSPNTIYSVTAVTSGCS